MFSIGLDRLGSNRPRATHRQASPRALTPRASTRRDFLKIGALGTTGLTLPGLLRARAQAAGVGGVTKDTSVVWLYLYGGATHIDGMTIVESFATDTAAFDALQGGQVDCFGNAPGPLVRQVAGSATLKALVSDPSEFVPFPLKVGVGAPLGTVVAAQV